jgi:8-oxo-dGTP pyrophosphatase MutT (NUDIX family)
MNTNEFPILDKPDKDGLHRNSDIEDGAKAFDANIKQRDAAVLIPLVRSNEQWHILFIRRAASEHDRHSGQVAFPGGAVETGDKTIVDAALRETHEEIGIAANRITVLGELDPYYTVSHFRVTAIPGIVKWPSNLNLEASEVARAFLIPFNWLKDDNNFTMRARTELDIKSARRHPIIVYNEYDGETLWGATARMTMNFIKAVDDKQFLLPG